MSRSALRIVYVTCSENGLYGLRHLHQLGWSIARVITISPESGKKYAVAGYIDVRDWCAREDIPVRILADYNVQLSDVSDATADILVVNGWNRLIKPEIIAAAPRGALGIHAGHPPIGLGRAPLPWNIIKGHRDLEVYVFRLTERADDGDIYARQSVEITPYDTVATLYEKVMYHGAVLFDHALQAVSAGRRPVPQDMRYAVHYPKRGVNDGAIDFRCSVDELVNFIRAQTRPYPGAFADLEAERWSIWSAQPFDCFAFRDITRVPGQIVLALPSGIVVQTGSAPLWITEATVAGTRRVPMSLSDGEALVGRVFSAPAQTHAP
jgi:methionyl-tRNA formyltransferase